MKLNRLQIDNFLGIKSVDVRLSKPVTLFAGANHSGKTSIRDAVQFAMEWTPLRDVTKKNEFAALVHKGEKAGGAQLLVDNDPDKTFAFNVPKGDFTGPEISEAMRVSLNGQRFSSMDANARRTFLSELTKVKPKADDIKVRMLGDKYGCDAAKVDAVLPMLRTGFPSVCEHAKSKATEAKGAWRAITSKTYGPVAAPAWEAPVPDLPEGDVDAMNAALAQLDDVIKTQTENLGGMKNAATTAQADVTKRASLSESAGKVDDLADQLVRAEKELSAYLPQVEALRVRAAGKARIGLVHDMAKYLEFAYNKEPERDALLARYETEHGPLDEAGAVDTAAQSSLPEHEKGLLVLQNRASNLKRGLDAALVAKAQFDALAPADDAKDMGLEIAEIEELVKGAKVERQTLANKILDIQAATRNRAEAEQKTKAALAHHNDVEAWTRVAEALAPSGIPAELLQNALAPVNRALEQAALDTSWSKVAIADDMEITANGRAYRLLSESEKWRTDAMLAQVVSELSGLKIMLLDRVDVLDLTGRGQLLDWMDVLASNDLLDTALLFGTFKTMPTGLFDTIEAFWVEDGRIAGQAQEVAA